MRRRFPSFPFSCAVPTLWVLAALVSTADAAPVRFNRDIRPILAENCLVCHGQDAGSRKAGLRLDVRDSAIADSNGIHAIVPGDSAGSELVGRVTAADADDRMPPASTGKSLTPAQIDLLKRWIDEGAEYQPHWSYIPPTRPDAPAAAPSDWAKNPIDAFVLSKMNEAGLPPAPEADRVTLIRRLSFDLIGLPPTPEEVDAFVADASPDAYEKQVDRLLASPRYGERMAVDWLDAVRYADTNGYHGDEYRSVWPYRDYVINAFNRNMPFDQFTVEQLAGDLLPDATREQKVASAYNRLNQLTAEGGAQAPEYIAKYAADRVRTTSTVWLGSTLGCAECHDHKFDPFTTKDFYSFSAFFADIQEKGVYAAGEKWDPVLPLPSDEQTAALKETETLVAQLQQKLDTPTAELAAAQTQWEGRVREELLSGDNDWLALAPLTVTAANGTVLTAQPDRTVMASGPNPEKEVFSVTFRTNQQHITGLRLEVFADPSFPNAGPGRGNGNFILTGFEVEAVAPGSAPAPVKIASASADFSQDKFDVGQSLDDKPDTGWAVSGHEKPANHEAVFVFAAPLAAGEGTALTVRLKHESNYAQHVIGKFRIGITTAPTPRLDVRSRFPQTVFNAVRIDGSLRTSEETAELARYYRSVAPELEGVRKEMLAAREKKGRLESEIPFVLATVSVEPRVVRVLPRGNWMDESGEVVQPAVPQFLPPLNVEGRRATRLDLAKWLVAPENPLVARVTVNRLWKLYFGTGLSKTLEDVGARGEWPTHPELLDWLAVEFVESGWDVKHMVRLMVTSAAYRQSPNGVERTQELDPYNRLLTHQSRYRLPAEFVRDNALAVSGLLADRIGGPSVKPYQPDGYWADCNTFTGPLLYDTSTGEDQYRRGLYTFWKRSFLHPSMLAFDAPTREECTAERVVSNTPLQALTLLNDPTYVEAARCFAARIVKEGGATFEERLGLAFRRALSRPPNEHETAVLRALCEKHLSQYQADPEAARKLLHTGQAPVPEDIEPAELAAWTSVARTVLNLYETVTRS